MCIENQLDENKKMPAKILKVRKLNRMGENMTFKECVNPYGVSTCG